jgi:hypothetical protein
LDAQREATGLKFTPAMRTWQRQLRADLAANLPQVRLDALLAAGGRVSEGDAAAYAFDARGLPRVDE